MLIAEVKEQTYIPLSVLEDIKAEIESLKMEYCKEIDKHGRYDLTDMINGINQCLCIIESKIGGDAECEQDYELCWTTGEYNGAECYDCPHRYECSGYDGDK